MNNVRRKAIRDVIKRLEGILNCGDVQKYFEQSADLVDDIEYIFSQEEDYMNNIPENLQTSSIYDKAEENCDTLEEAVDTINYVEKGDSDEYIQKSLNKVIELLNSVL